ncbi:hypothetical protein MMC34_004806 [Xylographa carneopallida]|nr:hypothetical protein [Xylographa carneopallida]
MLISESFLMATAVIRLASASPVSVLDKRVIATRPCSQDSIYSTFHSSCYTSSLSAFCTTFLRPTITASATVTVTDIATTTETPATQTVFVSPNQKHKRAGSCTGFSTNWPSASVNSACSCLLTSSPPAKTITAATVTATITEVLATAYVTPTVTDTCASAAFTAPIVNGGFESGSIAPWTFIPDAGDSGGIGHGTYEGNYVLYANNFDAPTPNVATETQLEQTLTLCPGTLYDISMATYFGQTGANSGASSINVYLGQNQIYFVDSLTSPAATWVPWQGQFYAQATSEVLFISFETSDGQSDNALIDAIYVTPATG